MSECPGRRQEPALGVFGVQPHLDGMAGGGHGFLSERQRLARPDPQLPLDQIEPGDHLGDWMLDLKARVHLHEIEGAIPIQEELDGAGIGVTDRLREAYRRSAQARR